MFEFKEKLVGVLGAGVEGLSSAKYLKAQGAYVSVLDQKNKEQLAPEIVRQLEQLSIQTVFSPEALKDLTKFEKIGRRHGVKRNPYKIEW